MFKALIACRAGVGSSLMLKIKAEQVIKEENFPIEVEHASLDAVSGFTGDLLITLTDVKDELESIGINKPIIGIASITNKEEIKTKLSSFIEAHSK
ncbi:PTS sugar transporter subunit IIB [Marinilactibacillus psychrotolerans]|uniref:Ascorbate-specific PTS system IIB component n=1 Tax=Marinilactibacillus psychrotolerans TaxID=191770 RepID=A0AAV3WV50_9LACT|nr:PTS sugar transporter subunit IIB [Marinilactibacillus psychrotolerans]GEL67614.1 PTS ascorbate transporter subunit IIB [Marinilactibacillus psychrotolerans]GEQ35502.1 ascorbate-specific PTS system IIB component [Marinilactibacillus psychrotolerans]SDD07396.1 PTS system, ascorbate-specific IIB component [Marinilactibacillus psychrotolerans]